VIVSDVGGVNGQGGVKSECGIAVHRCGCELQGSLPWSLLNL